MNKHLKKIRKKRIAEFMSEKNYIPLKIDELAVMLDVPKEEKQEFEDIINEMIKEDIIAKDKKGRFKAAVHKRVSGTLSCSRKGFFGFVVCGEHPDIFIPGTDMNGAIDGDIVTAEITGRNKIHYKGRIVDITERSARTLIGVITGKRKAGYKLKCDSGAIFAKVRIEPQNMMGADIHDRVAAEVLRYDGEYVFAAVKKILSSVNELESLTEEIICSHKLRTDFGDVSDALDDIPDSVSEEELVKRKDLRGKKIFTIDGDYSKDFDDAVSIEKTDAGYLLGVHIADVTHYVKEGDALDREAFLRGTSVYLADRTIPMLPEKLSNGICSLNPNVDRLTLSVFINFDNEGNRLNYKLQKSVICSCERMTYKNTAAILDGDKELIRRYKHIVPDLRLMKRLSAKLEKQRDKRGSIDFDIPEVKPVLDEKGEPIGIEKEERLVSHKIIESFMLAANEAVAEFASEKELPFVYRIHENLNEEKLTAVRDFLKKVGIRLTGHIDENNPLRPKQIQSVIRRTKGTPMEKLVSTFMLRSMMKARYSPECSGHFGLAAEYYCHFTSPIRRYPDLAIHRILKEKLDRRIGKRRFAQLTAFASEAAVKASDMEIEAMYCEREVDDLMKTAYMSRFIGSQFRAAVCSVTGFGIFAELENGAEGLIRIESMHSDYYIFDETLMQLTGKHTGRTYNIGDEIDIVLVRADIKSRQIDFVLSEDADTRSAKRAMEKALNKKSGTDNRAPQKKAEENKKAENIKKPKKDKRRKKSKKRSYYNRRK